MRFYLARNRMLQNIFREVFDRIHRNGGEGDWRSTNLTSRMIAELELHVVELGKVVAGDVGEGEEYGLIEEDDIIEVELQSDYNFTDTETKEYRYQAVFNVTHYQEA